MGATAEPIYTIRASRAIIQATVAALIDVLNVIEGDPDFEDATNVEDEGIGPGRWDGPGCPASDTDDRAWPEWHRRGRHKEACLASWGRIASEDAEDGDEDCGGGEGEPDFTGANRPHAGGGCSISDPGGCEHDGRELEDGL